MTRRMANGAFLAEQRAGIHTPQVSKINELCERLEREKAGREVPRVPPHYDARSARIISLLSNPGPKAGGKKGSGFISYENNDASAERMARVYESVALRGVDTLPWNAYPWYVHEKYPNGLPSSLIVEGLSTLKAVLEVALNVRAVVAHGRDAHEAARKFQADERYVDLISSRPIRFWETRHTSNRAFIAPPGERQRRFNEICDVYRDAMKWVGLEPLPAPDIKESQLAAVDLDDDGFAAALASPRMQAHIAAIVQGIEVQHDEEAAEFRADYEIRLRELEGRVERQESRNTQRPAAT